MTEVIGLKEENITSAKIVTMHILQSCEFVERWKRDYTEPNLAPKTLVRYEELLRRILPAIEDIRLDKLQTHHLIAFDTSRQNTENQSRVLA